MISSALVNRQTFNRMLIRTYYGMLEPAYLTKTWRRIRWLIIP